MASDYFSGRAAFYRSGRPTFEQSLRQGDSAQLAEAKGIIAEWEDLNGPMSESERQAAIDQALSVIARRDGRGFF